MSCKATLTDISGQSGHMAPAKFLDNMLATTTLVDNLLQDPILCHVTIK
jgi:hypothetical protein